MHPVDIGIRYSIGMATSEYGITDAQRKALGLAIHEAIILRGISQVELAETLQVNQSTISQWRCGKFLAPPRAIFALEEALDLPPGHLSQYFDFMPMPSDRKSNRKSKAAEIETVVLGDKELGGGEKAAVLAMVSQFRFLRRALTAAEAARAKPAARPRAKAAPSKARRPAKSDAVDA